MSVRAIAAVFDPDEKRLSERRRQVQRLAEEIRHHIKAGMLPRAVILCRGARLVFALPDTANFNRLCSIRSNLLVGVYDDGAELDRVRNDVEAALSEYFEGPASGARKA